MYKTIELIKKTNVSRETIRYYEKRGLICPVGKTEGGFKLYDEQAVNKIKFIKKIQKLTFTLSDIEEFFKLMNESGDPCVELMRMLDEKMSSLEKQRSDLKKMQKALKVYCSHHDHEGTKCPIIRDFADLELDKD